MHEIVLVQHRVRELALNTEREYSHELRGHGIQALRREQVTADAVDNAEAMASVTQATGWSNMS